MFADEKFFTTILKYDECWNVCRALQPTEATCTLVDFSSLLIFRCGGGHVVVIAAVYVKGIGTRGNGNREGNEKIVCLRHAFTRFRASYLVNLGGQGILLI